MTPTTHRSIGNTPTRRKTIGIDIDAETLVTAYLDVSQPSIPIRSYPNNPSGRQTLAQHARQFQPEIAIMEATGPLSLPVYDALRAAGIHCGVVNPRSLAALLRVATAKTDANDAVTLARAASFFHQLSWSNLPDAWQREQRERFAVLDRCDTIIRKETIRTRQALTAASCDLRGLASTSDPRTDAILRALIHPEDAPRIADSFRSERKRQKFRDALAAPLTRPLLERVVFTLNLRQVLRRHQEHQETQLWAESGTPAVWEATRFLQTVPLTDPLLAMRVLAEFGRDFTHRYRNVEAFCSACGVVPRAELSGGRVLKSRTEPRALRIRRPLVTKLRGYVLFRQGLPLAWSRWLDWLEARGLRVDQRAIALAHAMADAWYHVTKLQVAYDITTHFRNKIEWRTDRDTGEMVPA